VHEPAGIVHKGEYVVSQAELRNPSVVPMVRAIEGVRQSRKHGRAGVHGYADGGYTADDGSINGILVETIRDLRTELHALRTEKIHADINYQEFKEVKEKMETLEKKGKL
jgi:ribosomal protein L19E